MNSNDSNKQQKQNSQNSNQEKTRIPGSLGNLQYGKQVQGTKEKADSQGGNPYQHNPQTDIQVTGISLGNQQYGHSTERNTSTKKTKSVKQDKHQSIDKRSSASQKAASKPKDSDTNTKTSSQDVADSNPTTKESERTKVAKNDRNPSENQRNQDPTTSGDDWQEVEN